jgi:hypothetical protein
MPSAHKKVIVRKMDRDSVSGYVSPTEIVTEGKVDVLNTSGTVISIALREIKGVYFVREFGDSESLTRKTFTSRPRSEGLWVRLRFKDSEIMEGLMPSDLLQSTAEGFFVNPPDQRSNTQRIFVPRRGGSVIRRINGRFPCSASSSLSTDCSANSPSSLDAPKGTAVPKSSAKCVENWRFVDVVFVVHGPLARHIETSRPFLPPVSFGLGGHFTSQ